MDKIDKIIEILEKQDAATSSESDFIKSESNKDEEVKAFVENYERLKNLFHTNDHIDPEIIGEYILYKNGDTETETYLPIISEKIEAHLAKCDKCKMDYEQLLEEYSVLEKHLDEKTSNQQSDKSKGVFSFLHSVPSSYRVAIGAVLILISAYAGMKVTSEITTPFYKKSVITLEEDQNLSTRGRTSELFQKSISALSKDELKDAIEYLNEDIQKYKDDRSIFYSYYILGLVHLKYSVNSILGTFTSFNSDEVNLAIDNLQLSIEKNKNGLYDNLNLDAHYYIAVSYLLMDDTISAKKHLKLVTNERGKYYKEAAEILNSLEKY